MRENLTEWEEALAPYFNEITLLGEIPINQFEVDSIGNMIRELCEILGASRATRVLRNSFPRTFALFLSAMAARNNARGYWDGISEAIGLTKQGISNQRWGQIFLNVLQENDLPTFSTIGGYKYVSPIRIHGGIPAYSLQ